jgi:hypothetical protein
MPSPSNLASSMPIFATILVALSVGFFVPEVLIERDDHGSQLLCLLKQNRVAGPSKSRS